MRKRLISLAVCLCAVASMMAVPAKPGLWKQMKLTDGTIVSVELQGDEFMKYWKDHDGNCYTNTDKGLVPADMEQLRAVSRQLRSEMNSYVTENSKMSSSRRSKQKSSVSYIGDKRCLILLVQFSDMKFSMEDPKAFYQRVANEKGFNEGDFKGSVADYFSDQSNGKFNLTFDIAGPYTLANYANYGANKDDEAGNDTNPRGMVAAACQNAADEGLDFSPYDWDGDGQVEMVFVIYAGRGEASGGDENTIWPHKYQLATPTLYGGKYVSVYACSNEMQSATKVDGIGTICHEFSHCLGYPDVYDTSYNGFYGMGTWDLMCSGSYNGNSYCPAGYTAYEKWVAGWIDPINLTESTSITGMKPVADGGDAYIFTNPGCSDEYYIIENRQKEGWDASLAASGIIINHVNYDAYLWKINKPNTNDPDYNTFEHITIIPADNLKAKTNEQGDAWPYKGVNTLNTKSTPAAATQHANTDGTYFMNISISNMAIADDNTASFDFVNYNSSSSQEGYLLHETFDKCQGTGGNSDGFVPPTISNTFAAAAFTPDVEGWESTYKKGGSQCARFGKTNATAVTATSPEFEINGEAQVSFKCAPLGESDATLTLSASGAELTNTTISMPAEQWSSGSLTLKGTGKTKLTFTCNHAFFLDEVAIKSNTSNIENTLQDDSSVSPYTFIYNMQGQEIYSGKTADFNTSLLPAHGMYIMKQGNKTVKFAK